MVTRQLCSSERPIRHVVTLPATQHPAVESVVITAQDSQRANVYEVRAEAQRARFQTASVADHHDWFFPANHGKLTGVWISGNLYGQILLHGHCGNSIQQVGTIVEQERLGLDVLVHGEAERNDMVKYFWPAPRRVCLYAKRLGTELRFPLRVKPPIVIGDVSRPAPITVEWAKYAQSLTDKPVKGMLTGPVTILCWSFPREDVSRETIAKQIALALRDEVADLEAAGFGIIQIMEPALREGLPLRRSD